MTTVKLGPDSSELPDGSDLRLRVRTATSTLVDALRDLLAGLSPGQPQQLMRHLHLDKTLVSKLVRAVRSANPYQAAYLMPGRRGLERVIKGAERSAVDERIVARARQASEDFHLLVSQEVGGANALHTMLTGWVPEIRERVELRSKQAAFTAMRSLVGYQARAFVAAFLCRPGSDPEMADGVPVHGILGLTRLHNRTACAYCGIETESETGVSPQYATLEGDPMLNGVTCLLEDFSSTPTPKFEVAREGMTLRYALQGNSVGTASGVSFIFAEYVRDVLRRWKQGEYAWEGFALAPSIPTEVLQCDILIHKDLWPGATVDLWIRRPGAPQSNNKRDNDYLSWDRFDLLEHVTPLGEGTTAIGVPEMTNYPEMIRHVCQRLGWNSEEFRCFRCRVKYPLVGVEYIMRVRLPAEP